jgi:hypothetical protein
MEFCDNAKARTSLTALSQGSLMYFLICTTFSRMFLICRSDCLHSGRSVNWRYCTVYISSKYVCTFHRHGCIYALMIYTAPWVMFWMRAYPIWGGWEIESFLGPMKWQQADRRVPVGSQKTCKLPKHYAQGCINHRYIGGFMYKSPPRRFQGGTHCGGCGSRCIKELNCPAPATPPSPRLKILLEIKRKL